MGADSADGGFAKAVKKLPAMKEVDAAWARLPKSESKAAKALKERLYSALRDGGELPTQGDFTKEKPYSADGDAVRELLAVARRAQEAGLKAEVQRVRDALVVSNAPVTSLWAELGFGKDAAYPALRTISLSLGNRVIRIRGSIDRLERRDLGHEAVLAVVDFKTGKPFKPDELEKAVRRLARPQLVIYALALDAALEQPEGRSILGASRVAAVRYDYLRSGSGTPSDIAITAVDLARARAALDQLADAACNGRFWVIPLVDDPKKGHQSWGFQRGRLDLRTVARFEAGAAADSQDEDDQ
jgi:RecB family exonuclease